MNTLLIPAAVLMVCALKLPSSSAAMVRRDVDWATRMTPTRTTTPSSTDSVDNADGDVGDVEPTCNQSCSATCPCGACKCSIGDDNKCDTVNPCCICACKRDGKAICEVV